MVVVLVTGHALDEDVAAFMQAGANEVYTKPISRSQLHTALLPYHLSKSALST